MSANEVIKEEPYFKKLSYNLLCIVLAGLILYLGKDIILPLLFGMLLACLLFPITSFLARKKVPEFLSILLPLLVSLLSMAGVIYLLSSQIAHFFDDLPALKKHLADLTDSFQDWIGEHLHITARKQEQYINETTEKVKTEGPKLIGATFLSLTEMITYAVLIPVYTFLVLYYRKTIKKFFVMQFKKTPQDKVLDILYQSRAISQRYVSGLLIETCIVFTLNTIGFLILGIQYAIFLALTAALLNLVPYIGMLVANLLCIIVTLITADNPADALWVGVVLAVVQLFDNNIGMPLIVGNNVRINALATIVGVLVGGALCGIPGMFLAIPGLAVMKVISDRVPTLQAWGMLLGDEISERKHDTGEKLKSMLQPGKKKR